MHEPRVAPGRRRARRPLVVTNGFVGEEDTQQRAGDRHLSAGESGGHAGGQAPDPGGQLGVGGAVEEREDGQPRRRGQGVTREGAGLVHGADGGELLRERATATGALLVFDEVITGFRVASGGAHEVTGVLPDLVVLGKILGGGLPAAAFAGSQEHMERIAPAGDVDQAGTLSGNPLAVAAGRASLELLDEVAYAHLAATTEALATGLREAAGGRPIQVTTAPGLLTVFFSAEPVRDYAGAQACDLDAYASWCRALLARGVYAPASQFEAWFPSLAHDREQVERTVEAAAAAFAEVA